MVTTLLEEKRFEENKSTANTEDANTRRSQRTRFPSTRLVDHELFKDSDIADTGDIVHYAFLADAKTLTWEQAIKIDEWKDAMMEELSSIEKNRTWKLVELPEHKKAIEVKWVFKTKYKSDGSMAKLEARLVAKGFL